MANIPRGGVKHRDKNLSKEQVSFERAIARREPSIKRFSNEVSISDMNNDEMGLQITDSGAQLLWKINNRLFKLTMTEV